MSEKRNKKSAPEKYRKTYVYLWALLAVALAVVVGVSFVDEPGIGDMKISQGTFRDVITAPELTEEEQARLEEIKAMDAPDYVEPRVKTAEADTTVGTVLIFGDSMTILVANRLAAYGEKNGYRVVSVTWDGSSSVSWSGCDTLDNFIARYRPDFIMVTLGSNELFLSNFNARKPYVEKLVQKMGNIPFVWIGPPNWKEDVGFNAMMRSVLPRGTYYDSNRLDLPRGADHIHPTPKGGITWTDSIMSWMEFTPHPIPFARPDKGVTTRSHISHYFRAGKGGGAKGSKPDKGGAPASEPAAEASPAQPETHPAPAEAPSAPSREPEPPAHEAAPAPESPAAQ